MKRTNADVQERVWPSLVDKGTGRTLSLAPGESAEVDVPEGFSDPYLVPASPKKSTKAQEPAPPTEAEQSAPSAKE